MGQSRAMEQQERLIGQFERIAKYSHLSTVKSAVQKTIEESAKRKQEFEIKKAKTKTEPRVFIAGIGYSNITPEQAESIKAKTIADIENREANKKSRRKAKAAKTKANRIEAALNAEAEKEKAFKAMIAKKAQEQIAARNK